MTYNTVTGEGALTKKTKREINENFDQVFGQTVVQSANLVANTETTLANLAGMAHNVVPGVYKFRIQLQVSANGSAGTKAAIKQNDGATLDSISSMAEAYTASAVAVTRTTSTTDAASLVGATAAHVLVVLEGTLTVATAGSLQLQAAQNASHASDTTVFAGSTFELKRIG